MPLGQVRSLLADPDRAGSLSARARARRWQKFTETFPDLPDMTVVDLGGTPQFWRKVERRPAHVTCINLDPHETPSESWMTFIQGDACQPVDGHFDLAVSNSVIEHVGGHDQRRRFADVVHRAADRHWVQTPYRYFPIEPHWVFPGFQFLPMRAAMTVSQHWPYGRRSTPESAWEDVASVELVGISDMRGYFPDSQIWAERLGGLVKSLVAIKN